MICDTQSGIIVFTGDVQVSPAVITHDDLHITTTVQLPGQVNETTSEFAAIYTQDSAQANTSRLEDLIAAFDQLDIPVKEQIKILEKLHETGKLHARLIVDGQE